MLAWFLKLLGVSSEMTRHLADASWALQRPAAFWIGMALLVPVGMFIHYRHRSSLVTLPSILRNVLTGCRVAVLALMVYVLAGPYLKLDLKLERRPIVALLIDQSKSMDLPAGPFESDDEVAGIARAASLESGLQTTRDGRDQARQVLNDLSRAQLAHTVIEASGDQLLKPIGDRFDLRVFGVADGCTPIEIEMDPTRLGAAPAADGGRSAIGNAIEEIIEQAAGQQIAGILVFTDGQNNGGASLAHAAATAARANAPVFPVPVGSTTPIRDVAIADLFTPGLVSVGDTVSVSVTVESQGFEGRQVKVELYEGDHNLQSKDLTLRGTEQQQIELTFQAMQPGAHYLTVRVTPLDEEVVRENNQDVAFVRVDDQKLKVLYVEGPPRWDFRFLKNGMRRDHGLEPSIILESELQAGTIENRLNVPGTAEDWSTYRTVILGDCSLDTLTSTSTESLAEAVREKGLGLIVLAGPNHMPHEYEGSSLVELLPVRARRNTAGYDAAAYNPFKMEITPAGALHDALRLHEEPSRNATLWAQMPPYFWCAAVLRPAPGATVLATNPSVEDRFGKLPLIAYHYAGKGKVLFIGTDSTWLWRQNVGDRYFYKFWGQTVRFVARRDEKDGNKSWIEVRPLRVQPGDRTAIELTAFAPDGTPRTEATQSVSVSGPDGIPHMVTLESDGAGQGRYVGWLVPRLQGDHRMTLETADNQEPVMAELHVQYAAEELRRPGLDRPALELLGNQSGGQLVELANLAKLPEKLHGETKFTELHREETIWDNWFTAVLLGLIYCVDVGIRRLTGLS
jgi:hypothetical protein